ncbi:hypothetical protein ACK311_19995, partial [Aeromonas caviae]
NERSHWSGNGVHVESELVFMIGRNMQQLLSLTNAEDWHTMSQPIDEICVDPTRRCFWRSQAGPVPFSDQPRVLGDFLSNLQRTCIHHGYCVESDPLPQEEVDDA